MSRSADGFDRRKACADLSLSSRSSARQPLLVSHEPALHRGSPLHRKLAAASLASSTESGRDRGTLPPPARTASAPMAPLGEDSEDEDPAEVERRQREVAEQKARIVADMAGSMQESTKSSRPASPPRESHRPAMSGKENNGRSYLPPPSRVTKLAPGASSEQQVPPSSKLSSRPGDAHPPTRSPKPTSRTGAAFDTVSRNLDLALASVDGGAALSTPRESLRLFRSVSFSSFTSPDLALLRSSCQTSSRTLHRPRSLSSRGSTIATSMAWDTP